MLEGLQHVVSLRFLKFCLVGTTGLVVNLVLLAVLADGVGLHINLASALAIETSINSNFIINELWTFRDRRAVKVSSGRRWLKFHLVSLGGAAVQWAVFVALNAFWITLLQSHVKGGHSAIDRGGFIDQYLVRPIVHPPDVGDLKYLSQLIGIGVATLRNYFVNFHWTWKQPLEGES